MIAGVLFISL